MAMQKIILMTMCGYRHNHLSWLGTAKFQDPWSYTASNTERESNYHESNTNQWKK